MNDRVLTVVVPAYNVQQYLGACLDSLALQTDDRFEVVIIDDGSTDGGTNRICMEYADRYPDRFRCTRQENRGLGAARNAGLDQVRTPYVTFLDSDDWLDVRFVEYVLAALEGCGETIDLVFTLPMPYDTLTGQLYDWMDKPLFDQIVAGGRVVDAAQDKRLLELEPNACRRVYRMDFLREAGFHFPEGTRWEDVFPHFDLLGRARYCLFVPETGFYYRVNVPTSITASGGRGRLEVPTVFAATLKALLEKRDRPGVHAALKMLVSFSLWSVSVANASVTKELVDRLHDTFRLVPMDYIRSFMRSGIEPGQFRRVYPLVMKLPLTYKLFYDYQIVSAIRLLAFRMGGK